MPSTQQLEDAREKLVNELILNVSEQALSADSGTGTHSFENIVGVGISEKISANEHTDQLGVTVYVAAKCPKEAVASEALVPATIDGVPTDVVETGEFLVFPHKGKYRPVPGGVSVGHIKITAGTLGCLVKGEGNKYILSNNHVLADVNKGKPGDPITQPGPIDGGKNPQDVIANLSRFVPIEFGPGKVNEVDCAIAELINLDLAKPENLCFEKIGAVPTQAAIDMLVKKCGRTTQFTKGRITDTSATVRVNFGTSGVAVFRNQLVIKPLDSAPFSKGGDSGSLILTATETATEGEPRPVGLLFAGSDSHTLANPIGKVLSALGVSIVS